MEAIPIWLRISERWKIDPDYDAEAYHKREHLIERFKGGGAWTKWHVPEIVLAYLDERIKADPAERRGAPGCVTEAAAAMQMLPEDLVNALKSYRLRSSTSTMVVI